MADVNAVDLTQETLATLDGTEQIIMFDTAEGKRATVSAVGDYILKKLATLDSQTAQTVINNLKSRVSTLEGHNAFAEVMIGNSQIKADSAEDYLTFEAGTGITLTPDVTNDKVTIGTSLTKSNVGLGNVDNTADAVKEVAYADDAGTVNEHTVLTDVPANAVFTDTTYDDVIGDTPMGTTATTLTGAIAEHSQGLSDLTSKTYQRSVGLINPDTAIPLTQDEKNANLLIVEFNRYGFSRIAIFNPQTNYITSDPVVPSFGQVNLKVVPNALPVTSIKFTDNTGAQNVIISRFFV